MLRGFSVSNFKSFYDPQAISFAATKIVRHKDHVSIVGNRRILKSGVIFGANAGGKSNLIQAIHFSREVILNGLENVDLSKRHFRIGKNTFQAPGVFEYNLLVGDKEYIYGIAVSYAKREIVSEWLLRVDRRGKEFTIFNRIVDENGVSAVETDVPDSSKPIAMRLHIYFDDFASSISDALRRKTILEDIATRSNKKQGILGEIIHVYEWFRNMIILFPESSYRLVNEIASSTGQKDFFQSILQYFDTGIESISGQERAMDFEQLFSDASPDDIEKIKIELSKAATAHPIDIHIGDQAVRLRRDEDGNIIYNKLVLNHGNEEDLFDYSDESDGTRRLFDLIPLLNDKYTSSVIIIDEIDRSLHTNLVKKFFELFFILTENKNSQLIATTHDANIMDLDLLRQDEIWFVERDNNHSSKIFSLNKFKERFDKVVKNDYLIGRYGAIPMFRDSFLSSEVPSDDQ